VKKKATCSCIDVDHHYIIYLNFLNAPYVLF
jgi:hypothetical protein